MKFRKTQALMLFSTLLLAQSAWSHGYVTESRNYKCKLQQNTGCGSIIYEPQSVEGPDGFPSAGPRDGTLAAAGSGAWAQLNEQTPSRWHKTRVSPGAYQFRWNFTAAHLARDFRYYITKPDWNPSLPLARSSFDLTPFCAKDGRMTQPVNPSVHDCQLPSRSGYHVVLAVWDVGDTAYSFYNAVDLQFEGNLPPPSFNDIGDVFPSRNLLAGDRVQLRFFNTTGEVASPRVDMTIASDAEGVATAWVQKLATQVNTTQSGIMMGVMNSQGSIEPAQGKNDVFALSNSGLVRAEVGFVIKPAVLLNPSVSGVAPSYRTSDGNINLQFAVQSNLAYSGNLTVFSSLNRQVKTQAMQGGIGTVNQNIGLTGLTSGDYYLLVSFNTQDGQSQQLRINFSVQNTSDTSGQNSLVYPQGLGTYTLGQMVASRDGKLYRCKVVGWCNSNSALYYEPGFGLAWGDAWEFAGTSNVPVPVPTAQYVYPQGLGQYVTGTLVQGSDGKIYRCTVAGWCNSTSAYHYAPGTGAAWGSAWTRAN
jgi:chitin-binding protein